MVELTRGFGNGIYLMYTPPPSPVPTPSAFVVDVSMAAVGRNAAMAGRGNWWISARHSQVQLRLDESEFGLLAFNSQTLGQTMQTPNIVQMTFRRNQYPIKAQVGTIHLFRFVNMPLFQ